MDEAYDTNSCYFLGENGVSPELLRQPAPISGPECRNTEKEKLIHPQTATKKRLHIPFLLDASIH
jgi:hypothetical protein